MPPHEMIGLLMITCAVVFLAFYIDRRLSGRKVKVPPPVTRNIICISICQPSKEGKDDAAER